MSELSAVYAAVYVVLTAVNRNKDSMYPVCADSLGLENMYVMPLAAAVYTVDDISGATAGNWNRTELEVPADSGLCSVLEGMVTAVYELFAECEETVYKQDMLDAGPPTDGTHHFYTYSELGDALG